MFCCLMVCVSCNVELCTYLLQVANWKFLMMLTADLYLLTDVMNHDTSSA
jgi:hypothetical protein